MNDDELRARLQAADPAQRDAPVDSWIDELVEATMTENEQAGQERSTGSLRRSGVMAGSGENKTLPAALAILLAWRQ